MCLVFLVSLPFLAIHISYLISYIIIWSDSGTIPGSLFNNSWIKIMIFAKAIPLVHAVFYFICTLDWATCSVICVPWSIGLPWKKIIYAPVLLPVSGKYFQLESEKAINLLSVLKLACLNSYKRLNHSSYHSTPNRKNLIVPNVYQ